ncbi:MAG: hypothetical protein ACFCD0_13365 [Gemmataceae bacterium]
MIAILQQLLRYVHQPSLRPTLILTAGMPRSGSTWLYNTVRLLLESSLGHPDRLASGWIHDWPKLPQRETVLLKVHDFDVHLADRSRLILYSYRDIRDALASSVRKFGTVPTLDLARKWLAQDQTWRNAATFVMRYETMIHARAQVCDQIANALGIPCCPTNIIEQVQQLNCPSRTEYDPTTLLHPNHVTDGRHGTWRKWLSESLVKELELEFREWFEVNDYPLAFATSYSAS